MTIVVSFKNSEMADNTRVALAKKSSKPMLLPNNLYEFAKMNPKVKISSFKNLIYNGKTKTISLFHQLRALTQKSH